MNKLFRIILIGLLAAACTPQEESMDWLSRLDKNGTVADPAAVPVLPGEEAPETEQHDEYPETAEAKEARLARLGQTPIREVYYTEYTDKNLFPKLADIRCFTHVNVGHGRFVDKINGTGLEIPSETKRLLTEMVAFKAQYPELKVKLMIGGWGKNANGFSPMAADPEKRAAFVQNVKDMIEEYHLDGVDIDWEYPTYHAEGNEASPDDYVNFVTMFKELREAMPDKILSYAAPENGKYTDNYGALEYVDYINVMTYDMGNPQDRRHNAPLYTSPALKNDHGAADSIEKTFHGQGVPFGRMNFGIGFYGHGDGYKDDNGYYPGSVDYYRLEDIFFKNSCDGKDVTGKNYRIWDDNAKVPYLADAMGTMYASYEDIESVNAKVAFILEKQMLGAMVWEYRHDNVKGTLRRALRDAMAGNPMEPGRWERPTENLPAPVYDDAEEPETPENPETPEEPEPGTPPGTDLGSKGTANCYIVTAAGDYRFKAVKGNSTAYVGTVASVEVLWGSDVVASATYGAGYVGISTPKTLKPGNALVAAKDDAGKILWSWHIWVPKTQVGGNKYGLSFYTTMDRNLGALEAASATSGADSYGLLYQWGRKDPFPCKDASKKKGGKMSLAESIANPTTFADVDDTWMSSADKAIWGDGGTKTIYDPCPPGYKVPQREDLSGFFPMSPLSSATGWQYAAGHAFAVGEPQVWFPYSGYLDVTGTYTGAGTETKIWNSHMDSANNHGYGIFLTGDSSANSSQKAAQGGSVRCISVDQEAFVNEAGMPVQGNYTRVVFDNSVVELSGLCLSKDKDFLWGVGDEGYLYKFTNIDGDVSAITPTTVWTYDADMEGVTVNPSTGDLYLGIEPAKAYKVPGPSYNSKSTLFEIAEATGFDNSGVEGIAWYKGDLYIGAQSGATLWRYTLGGTKVWKKQLGTLAPGIEEVGDLFYDAQTDMLWVSDSEAHKLFVFDGAVTKLKAIYDVSFVGNAESVCVDHDRKCVWVGDDGTTSKIYKIEFTGL